MENASLHRFSAHFWWASWALHAPIYFNCHCTIDNNSYNIFIIVVVAVFTRYTVIVSSKMHSRVQQIMIGFYWYVKMLNQKHNRWKRKKKQRGKSNGWKFSVCLCWFVCSFFFRQTFCVWNKCRETRGDATMHTPIIVQ